jgi:hypothetical protein
MNEILYEQDHIMVPITIWAQLMLINYEDPNNYLGSIPGPENACMHDKCLATEPPNTNTRPRSRHNHVRKLVYP